jgi:hypothetical protein
VSIVKKIPHYSTNHCPDRKKRLMDPVGKFVLSQAFGDDGEGDGGSSCQGAPWESISEVLSSCICGFYSDFTGNLSSEAIQPPMQLPFAIVLIVQIVLIVLIVLILHWLY